MLSFGSPIRAGPLFLQSTSSAHPIPLHLLHSLLVLLGTGSTELSPPEGAHATPQVPSQGVAAPHLLSTAKDPGPLVKNLKFK